MRKSSKFTSTYNLPQKKGGWKIVASQKKSSSFGVMKGLTSYIMWNENRIMYNCVIGSGTQLLSVLFNTTENIAIDIKVIKNKAYF